MSSNPHGESTPAPPATPSGGDRPRIRAIFVDIDDTLYSTSDFASHARTAGIEAMRRAGLRMSAEEARNELEEVVKEFTSNHDRHYDKLLARIPPETHAGINPVILVAAAIAAYHDTKHNEFRAYDDAIDVLRRLRPVPGLTLGVITAGRDIKQAEKLWRLGVYPLLDPEAIFISDQIGISKPNVKLYQRACHDTGVRPEEALYIGDNPPHDIDPANACGMRTIHMKRSGQHIDKPSDTQADHVVHNFWDVLELLETHYLLGDQVSPTPLLPHG